MGYLVYGDTEIEHLRRKDKKLGAAIGRIGMIERAVHPDVFSAMVSSIVSQQISGKAADTVISRMYELLDHQVCPQTILDAGAAAIKSCGMSARKADYIVGIAEAAVAGTVDFDALAGLTDEEVIKKLSSLRGVGVWTAEMLLIFSLGRPDVVSFNDLAIRRGMMNLYGLQTLSREQFDRYRKRYTPYGTVASLYLWALSVE